MANLSCLILHGKFSLVLQASQRKPFYIIGALMIFSSFVMYESSFDVWSRIGNKSHVHMCDIVPRIIECIVFGQTKYHVPVV